MLTALQDVMRDERKLRLCAIRLMQVIKADEMQREEPPHVILEQQATINAHR